MDLLIFGLVVVLLFAPKKSARLASILAHPYLVGIGVASYSLYLLHQNAGLTLISVISEALGLTGAAALPVTVVVAVALIAISRIIFRYWENPWNRVLVKIYSKRVASLRHAPDKCVV